MDNSDSYDPEKLSSKIREAKNIIKNFNNNNNNNNAAEFFLY